MKALAQHITSNYLTAKQTKFAKNTLADYIRKDLKSYIENVIPVSKRYMVSSSPGKGVWTSNPWAAVFDIFITTTAQDGFYPVYIFRDDMSGFYLTLNQGVTKIRELYKNGAHKVLRNKAEDYRVQIGNLPLNFKETEIKLRLMQSTKKGLADDYEAGNIIAKFYSADNLPEPKEFTEDLLQILDIYKKLIYEGDENDEPTEGSNYKGKEKKKYRQHRRIERNRTLIKTVKKTQGYTCKACNINFIAQYGAIGENFIEAHHLQPISTLTEEIVELDARTDFVVLCSNCHRMIHRTEDPSDLESFKKLITQFYHDAS